MPAGADTQTWTLLISMVVMLGLFYFFMMRPQQKKEKETAAKRNSIEVGDEVTTIGGIVGRVVSVKDDSFLMETGADRVKIRFKRWAIQDVAKLNLDGTEPTEKKK